jgi:hypothetical protein
MVNLDLIIDYGGNGSVTKHINEDIETTRLIYRQEFIATTVIISSSHRNLNGNLINN